MGSNPGYLLKSFLLQNDCICVFCEQYSAYKNRKTAGPAIFNGNCEKLLNIYDKFRNVLRIHFADFFKILKVENNCLGIYQMDF